MRAYHDQALIDEFSGEALIPLPSLMARLSLSLILSDTIYPIIS